MMYNCFPFFITTDEYNLDFLYGMYKLISDEDAKRAFSEEMSLQLITRENYELTDFKNSLFPHLDKNAFDEIERFLYCISSEECAAHLTAYDSLLKKWSKSVPGYIHRVFNDMINRETMDIFMFKEKDIDKILVKSLCAVIIKQPISKNISGLNDFELRNGYVQNMETSEYKDACILHIIGYYIQKYWGMKFLLGKEYSSEKEKPLLGNFFKHETVQNKLRNSVYSTEEQQCLDVVKRSYNDMFHKYRNRVYIQTKKYFDDIWKQFDYSEKDIRKIITYLDSAYPEIHEDSNLQKIFEVRQWILKEHNSYDLSMYVLGLYMYDEKRGWML